MSAFQKTALAAPQIGIVRCPPSSAAYRPVEIWAQVFTFASS
jgi:hypothetical protein